MRKLILGEHVQQVGIGRSKESLNKDDEGRRKEEDGPREVGLEEKKTGGGGD